MIGAGLGDAEPVRPATGDTMGDTASAGAAMSTGRGSDRTYQKAGSEQGRHHDDDQSRELTP